MFTLKSKITFLSSVFLKRIALVLAGLLVGAAAVCAQTEVSGNALLVQLKSGEQQVFMLSSEPVITFDGGDCLVKSLEFNASYAMADIDFAKFVYADPASVDEIQAALVVDLSNPDFVVVKGMQAGGTVRLFDMSGIALRRASADDCGDASLCLSGVAKGVYIVNMKETTFKLYRK